MFEIVDHPIDTDAVIAATADPGSGATVTFIGTTETRTTARRSRLE
jgi:molybdopterin synthase catalytic subunit